MFESNLHRVFSALCATDQNLCGAIFYAPNNMETRIDLVEAVFTYRFHLQANRALSTDEQIIAAEWRRAKGKINTLKTTRNAIVHGSIISSNYKGKHQVRLAPQFMDVVRLAPMFSAKQHIGLGKAELATHYRATGRAIDRINRLARALEIYILPPSAHSNELRRELQKLISEMDSHGDNH